MGSGRETPWNASSQDSWWRMLHRLEQLLPTQAAVAVEQAQLHQIQLGQEVPAGVVMAHLILVQDLQEQLILVAVVAVPVGQARH